MSVAVVVTLALAMTVPGLVTGLALGLRGWTLAACAPLLSYGLVGVFGITLPMLGVTWSPVVLLSITVGVGLVGLLVGPVRRRLRGRTADGAMSDTPAEPSWSWFHHAGVAGAVVVSSAVGLTVTWQATGGLTAVPQIFDAVWHSNVIRYIADTGASDPDALRNLNNPVTSGYYYPNAYHVIAATAVMAVGASVQAVVGAGVAVLTVMLAVSMAAVVRAAGGRPALAAAAALLSCAFTAFPWDLLPWGTLLPFNTGLALVPAFLALLATALTRAGVRPGLVGALALCGIGLLALHPSVVLATVVFSVAYLAQLWLTRGVRVAQLITLGATAIVAVVLGIPLLTAASRAAEAGEFDWPATLRPADALGELLFLGHEQPYPQYWLAGLLVLGVVFHRSLRPGLWLVAAGSVFAGLFVMASAYEGELVAALTRPWWNDKWRFAGIWTLAAILLAATGLVALKDALTAVVNRIPSVGAMTGARARTAVSATTLAVVMVALYMVSDGLYNQRNEVRLAQAFSDGPTVSHYESEAFDQLAALVDEGEYVMNDPYDGSALMWALDGVRPVFASPVIQNLDLASMDPARRILFDSFNRLDEDPAVRAVLADLGVRYVIVCEGFIGPAADYVPGMQGVDELPSLQLVYDNPDARIYRIGTDLPVAGT